MGTSMKRLIALFVIGMTVMAGTAYAGFVVASQAPVAGDATYACVSTAGAVRPSTIRVNVVPVSCPKGSDVVRTLAVIPPVPAPLTPPVDAISLPFTNSQPNQWGQVYLMGTDMDDYPNRCQDWWPVLDGQNPGYRSTVASSVWIKFETGEWFRPSLSLSQLGIEQVSGHYVTEIKVTCLGG